MKVNELIKILNSKPLNGNVDLSQLLEIIFENQDETAICTGDYASLFFKQEDNKLKVYSHEIGFVFNDDKSKLLGMYNWKQ